MNHFKKALWGVLGIALLCLSGCGLTNTQKVTAINVAIPDDIVSLDPSGTKDALSETIARCIFSTLYSYDENLQVVPLLAESAERISELEWIFRIRKNVQFHDGSPLTAHDVKFSLERAMTIERAEKLLLVMEHIDVIDPYTFKVTTTKPRTDLMSLFVRVSTSIMSEKALQNPAYDINKPLGSGPFKIIERINGQSIRLERFEEYFLEPAKTPYLSFVVEPSEQNRTAGILNKKFNVVFRISPNDCDYLKLNENVHVYEHFSTKMETMAFNPDTPPLNDIRIRQAISYAINKQNIVNNVVSGYGEPLNGMLPSTIMGATDFEWFKYDPEKSRQLLAEAGYGDSLILNVLTFDEVRKKMMEYIKLDLAQVGIQLNYDFLELAVYLDAIRNDDYMCTIMSWTSNADPDSTFSQLYSEQGIRTVNHSKFSDKRVEELILEGRKEDDPQKRRQIYEEANKIVAASYFVLPLYQPSVLVAAGSDIGGVCINPQGLFAYENLYWITE